jgi:hypothetical protein
MVTLSLVYIIITESAATPYQGLYFLIIWTSYKKRSITHCLASMNEAFFVCGIRQWLLRKASLVELISRFNNDSENKSHFTKVDVLYMSYFLPLNKFNIKQLVHTAIPQSLLKIVPMRRARTEMCCWIYKLRKAYVCWLPLSFT